MYVSALPVSQKPRENVTGPFTAAWWTAALQGQLVGPEGKLQGTRVPRILSSGQRFFFLPPSLGRTENRGHRKTWAKRDLSGRVGVGECRELFPGCSTMSPEGPGEQGSTAAPALRGRSSGQSSVVGSQVFLVPQGRHGSLAPGQVLPVVSFYKVRIAKNSLFLPPLCVSFRDRGWFGTENPGAVLPLRAPPSAPLSIRCPVIVHW